VRLTGILLALTASSGLAAAPINDDISNAVIVPTVLPYSDAADTSEATAAASDPEDEGCSNNGSVWYSFTPETDFSIEANTIGSNYDTTLGAYEGSPGSLSVIVCNDDASSGVQSAVRLNVTAGSTYYFMVGFCCGNGESGGGDLIFTVRESPPALELELRVDSVGYVNQGIPTVSGSLTCNVETQFPFLFGNLKERAGRQFIQGFFNVSLDSCTPASVNWSARVEDVTGVFVGGKAAVSATGVVCDSFTCIEDSVDTTIRLSGKK
jgi:hypothetical protein